MTDGERKLFEMMQSAARIAFLGGAGLSTESGIPDFRGEAGLYKAQNEYGYAPETLLSHSFFMRRPEIFFDYYRKNLICPDARPNPAHVALAELERMGRLTAVITQNIDGLHQTAGSRTVLELHGSVSRNHCMRCGKSYGVDAVLHASGVPRCSCGGIIKPDVVLYEEGLDTDVLEQAVFHISRADMLIIGGTSLTVYPAAGLSRYYRGHKLAVLNLSETYEDERADLTVRAPIGEVLESAVGALRRALEP